MTAAPNIISVETVSVVEWIKAALSQPSILSTDKIILNGFSGDKNVEEAIASLALAHKKGGIKAAKTAWDEQISKTIPQVTEIINRPKRLYHCDELNELPPMRWLIDGEIPERGLGILYGQPGTGKSFLALEYCERVSQRRPVVYIAGEGVSGYPRRHAAWLQHNKIKSGKLYFWTEPVNFLRSGDVDLFIEEIRALNPHLVVIDTLARCMVGGNEDKADDMGLFISNIQRMQTQLDTAALVIHHTPKGTTATPRGSGALGGAADVMIEMTDNEDAIKIACAKMKDAVEFEPRYVKMHVVTLEPGITSCVLVDQNRVQQQKDHLTPNQKAIIEWLASDEVFGDGARAAQLKSATSMNENTFYKVVRNLAQRGFIKRIGKQDPWVLTNEGHRLARLYGFNKTL